MSPTEAKRSEFVGPSRERFLDPVWHERELETIFRPRWHFAGHSSELAETGSYMTFALGDEEVVLVRAEDGAVHAYHNFCRHRGFSLCTEQRGKLRGRRIVCRYHSWSYSPVDGSCRGVRMHEGFDPEPWSLVPAWVDETDGLIFVSFGDERPTPMTIALHEVGLGGYDLARMKLAARRSYVTKANWKVVIENQHECYHCAVNHPALCTNYDPWDNDYLDGPPIGGVEIGAQWKRSGITYTINGDKVCDVPTPREDGQPADSYMVWWKPGNILTFARDYAFIVTVRPVAADRTLQENFWLVHEDATEGVAYDRERLTQLTAVTLDEDVELCEQVQRNLGMRQYRPGPLHPNYQAAAIGIYQWYEEQMRAAGWVDESVDLDAADWR